jgi:hypothetical protein
LSGVSERSARSQTVTPSFWPLFLFKPLIETRSYNQDYELWVTILSIR